MSRSLIRVFLSVACAVVFFSIGRPSLGQPSCTITCPTNITRSNDPNQCGAVTTYPAPTTTGTCGTITCSPASGSFFPKGTTTVTCTATAGPSCTFTVTVNDTQPPTITCPANITRVTFGPSTPVTYSAPAFADNCPGSTVVCTPPSGSNFAPGTTTVTCTATDGSGNTATCSFSIVLILPVVPTLSQWGMMAMGLLLAIGGLLFLRVRQG